MKEMWYFVYVEVNIIEIIYELYMVKNEWKFFMNEK